jgi:hypothetical protein
VDEMTIAVHEALQRDARERIAAREPITDPAKVAYFLRALTGEKEPPHADGCICGTCRPRT